MRRAAIKDCESGHSEAASNAAKSLILAAARAEFASKGLDGARVNEIAAKAGVNKQLLYYYFGNKEVLYRAALEDVYAEIRQQEQALALDGLSPLDAMTALIGFSFDYLASHPEFIGLLNQENALGAQMVAQSMRIRQANSPLIALIAQTLERGAALGIFRTGVDAVAFYISMAGMAYFYFSNTPTLSAIFGRDLTHTQAQAAYRQHVIDFCLAGLRT